MSLGKRISPLYNNTNAHLVLDDETITKSVSKSVIRQYQQREMISYFINQHGWTSRVFCNIHWAAVGMAVSNLQYK